MYKSYYKLFIKYLTNYTNYIMETKKYENFPEYAVTYCAYGETNNDLTEEDIKNIDEWMKEENLDHLVDVEDSHSFSNNPEFGLPCDVVTAIFITKQPEEDKEMNEEFFESIFNEAEKMTEARSKVFYRGYYKASNGKFVPATSDVIDEMNQLSNVGAMESFLKQHYKGRDVRVEKDDSIGW